MNGIARPPGPYSIDKLGSFWAFPNFSNEKLSFEDFAEWGIPSGSSLSSKDGLLTLNPASHFASIRKCYLWRWAHRFLVAETSVFLLMMRLSYDWWSSWCVVKVQVRGWRREKLRVVLLLPCLVTMYVSSCSIPYLTIISCFLFPFLFFFIACLLFIHIIHPPLRLVFFFGICNFIN